MSYNPEILFKLYLIRHGQTKHNLAGKDAKDVTLNEIHNPPLNDTGINQAVALGEYYSRIDFDCIYSSGMNRALMTAEELCKRQKTVKKILVKPDIAEVRMPVELTGVSFCELKKQYPDIMPADGYDETYPTIISDGECAADEKVYNRAGEILSWFQSRYKNGEKVAVVSHSAIMTYMLFHLLGFRADSPLPDFAMYNTGVTEIIFFKPGTYREEVVIEYVNSVVHLPDELKNPDIR